MKPFRIYLFMILVFTVLFPNSDSWNTFLKANSYRYKLEGNHVGAMQWLANQDKLLVTSLFVPKLAMT